LFWTSFNAGIAQASSPRSRLSRLCGTEPDSSARPPSTRTSTSHAAGEWARDDRRQSGGKVRAPENSGERGRIHSSCVRRRPGGERANRCRSLNGTTGCNRAEAVAGCHRRLSETVERGWNRGPERRRHRSKDGVCHVSCSPVTPSGLENPTCDRSTTRDRRSRSSSQQSPHITWPGWPKP
jgi:hypothetical protein